MHLFDKEMKLLAPDDDLGYCARALKPIEWDNEMNDHVTYPI